MHVEHTMIVEIFFSTDYGTFIKINHMKSSIICKICFKLQIPLTIYVIILKSFQT